MQQRASSRASSTGSSPPCHLTCHFPALMKSSDPMWPTVSFLPHSLQTLSPVSALPGISAHLSGSSVLGKCLFVNKNSLQVFQRLACFPSQVPGRKITNVREERVTEGVTLSPQTLGLCPLQLVPQGLLCQNWVLSRERVWGGRGPGESNNATVSGSRSWRLDLIRLGEPGEREREHRQV